MYTGTADHSLTAELVALVDVPVIASGDITSRATRADGARERTGARRRDGRPRRPGQPLGAARDRRRRRGREPTREEVVAELVLFIRETVRELGERRATGFLKKFYGWYLGRGRFPRAVQAGARRSSTRPTEVERAAVRRRAGRARAASSASRRSSRRATRCRSSLPISIYGGG